MDSTFIDAVVSSRSRRVELAFLLDSGQMYTCLPAWAVAELGLATRRLETLHRADGQPRRVAVGECFVECELGDVTTPVILGEANDLPILGTLTLAELGFVLEPLSREIRPAIIRLAAAGPVGRGDLATEIGLADPPAGYDRPARR